MTITEFQSACSAIEQEYKTKIAQAADLAAVEELRVAALGRKGALTELLKGLKDFSIEEKKQNLAPKVFPMKFYPDREIMMLYRFLIKGKSGSI